MTPNSGKRCPFLGCCGAIKCWRCVEETLNTDQTFQACLSELFAGSISLHHPHFKPSTVRLPWSSCFLLPNFGNAVSGSPECCSLAQSRPRPHTAPRGICYSLGVQFALSMLYFTILVMIRPTNFHKGTKRVAVCPSDDHRLRRH